MERQEVLISCEIEGVFLSVIRGNIIHERSDAIVNAANRNLAHMGGVAGAIYAAAGREMGNESKEYVRKHGVVPTGSVAVTGPGKIPIRCIIHAIGPNFKGKREDEANLYSAVYKSFEAAHELRLSSISIPAISSGIFGCPKETCASIMVSAALNFIREVGSEHLKAIRFTNNDSKTSRIFKKELEKVLSDT